MPVTVATANGTHFEYEGDLYPRNFSVFPSRKDDARLVSGSWSLEVALGSTVGGSVPADQEALIDALVPIVSSGNSSGGATASEIGDDLRGGAPLPMLPSHKSVAAGSIASGAEVIVAGYSSAWLTITAGATLTGLSISLYTSSADAQPLVLDSAAAFLNAGVVVPPVAALYPATDPTTLANGTSIKILLDIVGVYKIVVDSTGAATLDVGLGSLSPTEAQDAVSAADIGDAVGDDLRAGVGVPVQGYESGIPVAVKSTGAVLDVTFSLDTSAYASGDLLADTQAITDAVRINGGRAVIQSVTLIDEDDQGVAMSLVFLSASNTLGTENSAPSISDANARDILAVVEVGTYDWRDLGGVRIASLKNIGAAVKAASGTTSLYVAVVNGTGTPTFTAAGLKAKIGLLWD